MGAGAVMIWDEGTYRPERKVSKGVRKEIMDISEAQEVASKSLKDGNLKFRLYGKKLQGIFRTSSNKKSFRVERILGC